MVANESLEKARAHLNQVPRDRRLYIPSEGCGENTFRIHLLTLLSELFVISVLCFIRYL